MIDVDIQDARADTVGGAIPSTQDFQHWVETALAGRRDDAQLSIRLVDESEISALNERYRGKTGPTNVLSFPFEPMPGVDIPLLGDVVICAPVVETEARDQDKTAQAHWAHMVVHGTLHLLGYDHIEEDEAVQMEGLESDILARLGFPDPYGDATEQ